MSATEIHGMKWADGPPPAVNSGGAPGLWEDRMVALAENPGNWATFGPYSAASAARGAKRYAEYLTTGEDAEFPGTFEITTRTEGEDVWVWAVYREAGSIE